MSDNYINIDDIVNSINIGIDSKISNNYISSYKLLIIKILYKLFYYFLHLSLISLFETLFYFFYISGQENNGINKNIIDITGDISNVCNSIPIDMKYLIIEYVKAINNTNYINSINEKNANNNELFKNAMIYVYTFISITFFIGLVLFYVKYKYDKYRINNINVASGGLNNISYVYNWTNIFFDTITILCVLFIYEYNFFMYIVKKYSPISKYELEHYAKNEFLELCK